MFMFAKIVVESNFETQHQLDLPFYRNMQYIDKYGQETFFTIDTAPEKLKKKRTLLEYFHNYMSENLLKVSSLVRECEKISP